MYTTYFGLREKPFSIAPDPRYLYMSELHREALAHLLHGISSDGCFILLTGDVGTGKSILSRCLLKQIEEKTDVALVVNAHLTVLELLKTICNELEVPLGEKEQAITFYMDSLNRYLQGAHARGRNTVLLIDEAQTLSLDLLKQLSLLTNLEIDGEKLLKIVLLGQAELRHILEKNGVDQISERITSRYHLLPLERADVSAYVRHRLAVAGGKEKIFSEAALGRVYELSQGIPRLINVLCDRSLLDAYKEKKYLVNEGIVEKAAREVFGDVGERREKSLLTPMVSFVFFSFCARCGGAGSFFLREPPQPPMISPAENQVEKKELESIPVPALLLLSSVSIVFDLQEEAAVIDSVLRRQPEDAAVPESSPELEKQTGTTIRIVPLEISE